MSAMQESLPELEARRAELYARLLESGDLRRGSVSENYRRCGKANCACAQPEHPGHGPRLLWTRTGPGGKTVGRQLAPQEVDKVRRELAAYREFVTLSEAILAVNEEICEARAPSSLADAAGAAQDAPAAAGGQKGGSSARSRKRSPPR